MGLPVVLLFWAVIGLILACISSCVLGLGVWLLTRGAGAGRRRTIAAALVLPFACGVWTTVLFVVQAVINESVLHRDLGIGDTWHCPLPNGYHVMMIDVTDQGTVYNPATQRSRGSVSSQEDAVFGVRTLQIAGPLIFGAADSSAFEHLVDAAKPSDSYFVLDTRLGKRRELADLQRLREEAGAAGVTLNLEPIATVYSRYRFSWFEVVIGALLLVPMLAGLVLLVRSVIHLRRTGSKHTQISVVV